MRTEETARERDGASFGRSLVGELLCFQGFDLSRGRNRALVSVKSKRAISQISTHRHLRFDKGKTTLSTDLAVLDRDLSFERGDSRILGLVLTPEDVDLRGKRNESEEDV